MKIIRSLITALAILTGLNSAAFATSAAPAHYTSPLSCVRNFFVSPAGADTATCGAGPMNTAGNCRTPWGADAATSIGNLGTGGLTGGDCVNVFGTTPTQTALGSSGWTAYNTPGGVTFNRSGTSNSASGYINYVCSVNHGCKITKTAAGSGSVARLAGNFIALDGFEWDGVNQQGYTGYHSGNTNTYNGGAEQIFSNNAGHHHFWLNNISHGSGAGVLGDNSDDYQYFIANEGYDGAGVNICHTSGTGLYEPISIAPNAAFPWDTNPYKTQWIANVMHDNGETASEPAGNCNGQGPAHTDGENIQLDDWQRTQTPGGTQYTGKALVAYNYVYNAGGKGIQQYTAGNVVFENNTTVHNCLDPAVVASRGCKDFESAGVAGWNGNGTSSILQNNLAVRVAGGSQAAYNVAGANGNGISHNESWDTIGGGNSFQGGLTLTAGANPLLGVNPNVANLNANPPDMHPNTGSPALGSGIANITSQFALMTPDGQVPSNPPNMGAFNVAGGTGCGAAPLPPCPPPPPPPSVPGPVSIAAGTTSVYPPFIADAGVTGGTSICNNLTNPVVTTADPTPAPLGVYKCERYGTFSYIISSLTPGANYTVVFHFTEDFWTAALQRIFNVSINGVQQISKLDIFAVAGAQHTAIARSFTQAADINGQISIAFSPDISSPDQAAKVDGLEVLSQASLGALSLSKSTFISGVPIGTTVGNVNGKTTGSIITIGAESTPNSFTLATVGGVCQLNIGNGILTGANSYTFNLIETLVGANGSPKTTVAVPVTETSGALSPLTLSASTFQSGAAQGTVIGQILGTTAGSTVAITSQSTANAVQAVLVGGVWTLEVGSGAIIGPNTYTFSLVETFAPATNSPNTTTGFSVSEQGGTLQTLSLAGNAFVSGAVVGTPIGNLIGTTPGSAVTIGTQSTPNAFQVALVAGTWQLQVGSGALTGTNNYTLSLVETLFGALGSPKTTPGLTVSETSTTLQPLTLAAATFVSGSPIGTTIGNVMGTTTGSSVVIGTQSVPNALQLVQLGNLWQLRVGSGALPGANTYTFSLVETLAGAIGNPNTTAGLVVTETPAIVVGPILSAAQFSLDNTLPVANVLLRDRNNQWDFVGALDSGAHLFSLNSRIAGDLSAVGSPGSGKVGEPVSQVALAQAIASATPTNLTSKTLLAGHWSCNGYITTNPAPTTTESLLSGSISNISGVMAGGIASQIMPYAVPAGISSTLNFGPATFDLAAPQQIFVVGNITYAVSTLTADAGLFCTRYW